MGKQYIIGIDSGTQSTRTILFDTEGNQVCKGVGAHPPLIAEKQGWAEHGEMDVWNGLCTALKDMFSKFEGDKGDIVAIGLSSQRGTTVGIDEKGNVLQRPISWMDFRLADPAKCLPLPEGCDHAYDFMRLYSKVNWCKQNKPEVAEKVYKWLTVAGFLGYKLCGDFVDTVSNQTGAWPIDRENWKVSDNDGLFECLGLRRDQYAKIILPGEQIGNITAEGAAATGLPQGLPVYACAGDKQCELLGAGAISTGQSYITLGTCVSMAMVGDHLQYDPQRSFLTYLSCVKGYYNFEASLARGYWLISWFRDNLGMDLKDEAKAQGVSIEAMLDAEAEKVPPGSEGLLCFPDWQPPRSRPYGKGIFIGFDDRHKRAHIFRSLLESISMQLKINSDLACSHLGMEVTELRIGGGGSKSDVAMQLTADIFNVPTIRAHVSETCSLGAAMCAAVGLGLYPSFEDAVDGMVRTSHVFQPIPENNELYSQLMEKVLKKIYPTMESVLADLVALTSDH